QGCADAPNIGEPEIPDVGVLKILIQGTHDKLHVIGIEYEVVNVEDHHATLAFRARNNLIQVVTVAGAADHKHISSLQHAIEALDFCSAKPRSGHVLAERVEHLNHVEHSISEGTGVWAFVKIGNANRSAL